MKTEFEYIRFEQIVRPVKTTYWACRSKGGDLLGLVHWHGPWRQYCFFAEGETIFSAGCLRDIQAFLKDLNVQHYAKAETAPSACPGGKGD